ncbi:MAG: hypothetical protein Q7S22_08170 [Candidatus Micrarchaeota archaeon]|nr:hypothetical protein [Candidatus Micrarchaeota archaeon]
MKKIASFLLFLLSVFMAESSSLLESPTLHQIQESNSGLYADTNFDFTYNYNVFTTATVLEGQQSGGSLGNNAVVCPSGTLSMVTTVGSTWSPLSMDSVVSNICATNSPIWSGSLPSTRAIQWDSGDYTSLSTDDFGICRDNEGCWGLQDPTYSQKVSYQDFVGAPIQSNKRGSATVVCKGNNNILIKRATSTLVNRNTPLSSLNLFSESLSNPQEGTYTFDPKLDIQGCTILIQRPSCSGVRDEFAIFSRTSASSGTSASQFTRTINPSAKTITVENRIAKLEQSSSNPANGAEISMNPGGTKIISITVRNGGTTDRIVTSVRVDGDAGFTVVPDPQDGCTANGGGFSICNFNGFDETIQPGTSKKLDIKISASASVRRDAVYSITIIPIYQSPVACSNQDDVISVRYVIRVPPQVPPNLCPAGNTDPACPCEVNDQEPRCKAITRCSITPSSVSVIQNTQQVFSLSCGNSTAASFTCSSVQPWTLASVSGGFTGVIKSQNNLNSIVNVTSSAGIGKLTAQPTGTTANCNATITAQPSLTCTLTHPTTLPANATGTFNAICNLGGTSVTCQSSTWSASPQATFSSQNARSALISFAHAGSAQVSDTVAYNGQTASCSASLTITVLPPISCTITPSNVQIQANTPQTFTSQCFSNGAPLSNCPSTSWSASPSATVQSHVGNNAVINFAQTGNAQVSTTVINGGRTATCSVSETIISNTSLSCTIDPSGATISVNSIRSFTSQCFSNGVAIANCPSTSWSASPSATVQSQSGNNAAISFAQVGNAQVSTIVSNGGQTATCSVPETIAPSSSSNCTIDPSGTTVQTNAIQHFSLVCFDRGVDTLCSQVAWSGSPAATISNNNNAGTDVQFAQEGAATVSVTALSGSDSVVCTAPVTVAPAANNSGFPTECLLSPSSASVQINSLQSFALTCSNAIGAVPCTSTRWSLENLVATRITETNTNTVLNFTSEGNGAVSASVPGEIDPVVCVSPITVFSGNDTVQCSPGDPNCDCNGQDCRPFSIGCQLSSTNLIMHPNDRGRISIKCPGRPGGICDRSITWDVSRGIPIVIAGDSNSATFIAGSHVGDQTLIRAYNDVEHIQCFALISVNKYLCSDYS